MYLEQLCLSRSVLCLLLLLLLLLFGHITQKIKKKHMLIFTYIPIVVCCLREVFRMFQAAGYGHYKYTCQGYIFCPVQTLNNLAPIHV